MAATELPVACCAPLSAGTLGEEDAIELEGLLRAIADRHRLKILNLLLSSDEDAICVCDFTEVLGLSQPTVSHHLGKLIKAGLLEREKRGSFAYYRLAEGALDRVGALFATSVAV